MEQQPIDQLSARVKELEQLVEEQRGELEVTKEDLHSFSYKLSHDLHAPLRAICTYVEMISSDYADKPLDSEAQRLISRVRSNAEEMKHMLDGLLDFVRTGKKEIKPQRLSMTDLVKDICQQMQQQDAVHPIHFQVNELSDGYGDEELIKKVWMLFISNAVKFTGKKEVRTIEIDSEKKEGQVIYRIKDNGDGFDMSYYPKLFGVFQRLHHKTDFEGTGMGLATVAKIVSRHKGKAWGEGTVKEGATFYFSLPMPYDS